MENKKKASELPEDPLKKKTSHQLTQEQLADIYFSGSEKLKKSDYPTVIRVSEKHGTFSLAPWIVAAAALLIAALSLYSTKRIFIDIKIMDEHTASLASPQSPPESAEEAASDAQRSSAMLDNEKNGMHLGDPLPLQNVSFEGASKLKSSKDKLGLTLINSSVAPFARAVLHFDQPMNFARAKIIFYAKGSRGGENIAFAIKDKDNVSAFNKNKIYPFPSSLTTDWQRAEIPMFEAVKEFDAKNVVSLRFEFGSKDTDNKPGDTIFVKDLRVVPV